MPSKKSSLPALMQIDGQEGGKYEKVSVVELLKKETSALVSMKEVYAFQAAIVTLISPFNTALCPRKIILEGTREKRLVLLSMEWYKSILYGTRMCKARKQNY